MLDVLVVIKPRPCLLINGVVSKMHGELEFREEDSSSKYSVLVVVVGAFVRRFFRVNTKVDPTSTTPAGSKDCPRSLETGGKHQAPFIKNQVF
jgi:hypothetical protein